MEKPGGQRRIGFGRIARMAAMLLLAALAVILCSCSRDEWRTAKRPIPKITSTANIAGYALTEETWTDETGKNTVVYYFENDEFVLRLIRSEVDETKAWFRLGRADVPKPDRNYLLAGSTPLGSLPKEQWPAGLRELAALVIDFATPLVESEAELATASEPWVVKATEELSAGSFQAYGETKPYAHLSYAPVPTDEGTAYFLVGPWWLLSWVTLEEDNFTIFVDTRDDDPLPGAYEPEAGTAVIRGTYEGDLQGFHIEGTEISEYRNRLIRETATELEALVPFVSSDLYDYPGALAERCSAAASVLRKAEVQGWNQTITEDEILQSNWVPSLSLRTTEAVDGDDVFIGYTWTPELLVATCTIRLHVNGAMETDFLHFTYIREGGEEGALYDWDSYEHGSSLKDHELESLTSFLAAVDKGLIDVPERYAVAYEQLRDFVANPSLPEGRKVEKLERWAHHLD